RRRSDSFKLCCQNQMRRDPTVELTRRRESIKHRRMNQVAKHAPAARVQRFVRRRLMDKTSSLILIQLPILITDESGIIQICEIRQKHPRGQRLKLEQAHKQSNGQQWIWNECKEAKKRILRAEEHIIPDRINTHHRQKERQRYGFQNAVAVVSKNSVADKERDDVVEHTDNNPHPKWRGIRWSA